MNIHVLFRDGSQEVVCAAVLQQLIDNGKISKFYRHSEKRWVIIGLDPTRRDKNKKRRACGGNGHHEVMRCANETVSRKCKCAGESAEAHLHDVKSRLAEIAHNALESYRRHDRKLLGHGQKNISGENA